MVLTVVGLHPGPAEGGSWPDSYQIVLRFQGLVTFKCTNRRITPLPAGTVTLICWVVPLSLRIAGALTPDVLQSLVNVSLH